MKFYNLGQKTFETDFSKHGKLQVISVSIFRDMTSQRSPSPEGNESLSFDIDGVDRNLKKITFYAEKRLFWTKIVPLYAFS